MAEVSWQDAGGSSFRARATLEDMSASGACLRVQSAVPVGSRVMIKWYREQFSAVARNCRQEGRDYLLGVRREADSAQSNSPLSVPAAATTLQLSDEVSALPVIDRVNLPAPKLQSSVAQEPVQSAFPTTQRMIANSRRDLCLPTKEIRPRRRAEAAAAASSTHSRSQFQSSGTSPRPERKAMHPKTLFPQFWRRQHDGDAPAKSTSTEASVNKPTTHATESASGPRGDLLSCEDIYRAAGVMSPGSGYGIHKVVEMLNSERIRDLSKDIKRAWFSWHLMPPASRRTKC